MSTSSKRSELAIIAAAFAAFLATFNETFLNVALTPIMNDFGTTLPTVQWLATGYMLAAAVMVPVSGILYRRFKTRPLFITVVAFLVVGSLIGALAHNFTVLLIGRLVQAIGTGLLVPLGMNITLDVAPKQRLGTYLGIMGAMTTLGPSSSIIVSGVLIDFLGWRSLMWTFGALALLCLIIGAATVQSRAELTNPRLDYWSVVLVSIGLIGIMYAISISFTGDPVVAIITGVIGIIAIVAFVRRQNRIDSPLINLAPLKIPAFTLGLLVNVAALMTVFAINMVVPIYLQSAQGTPALTASLALLPAILVSFVLSPIFGSVYDKHGGRILLPGGPLLMAIFTCLIAIFAPTAPIWVLALLYVPVQIGSAMTIGPVQTFALSKLSPELNSHGVTVLSVMFQLTGCIGSSVFVGIYSAVTDASTAATGFTTSMSVLAAIVFIGFILGFIAVRLKGQPSAPVEGSVSDDQAVLNQIMKTDVYQLAPSATLQEALEMFVDKNVSGVPVAEDGRVRGFISDGDLFRHMGDVVPVFSTPYAFLANQNTDLAETMAATLQVPVLEVARTKMITIPEGASLEEVCEILAENHLKKAPVVDASGVMIGVVNRSDINRYLAATYLKSQQ